MITSFVFSLPERLQYVVYKFPVSDQSIIHRFLKLEIYEDSNTLLEDKNVLTNRKITFIWLFLYACFAGKLTVTVTEFSMNKEEKE
jgi:hypothetical protein